MSTFIKSLIHLLAAISLYIVAVVGLGWFWTIGTADNYERINNVLINLSYSFLTGYVVYLLTILIPAKRRSERIGLIVAERLQGIVRNHISPCLRVFVPPNRFLDVFSDRELVEMFEQGDLLEDSFRVSHSEHIPIFEYLYSRKDGFLEAIDCIINDYGNDLSEDYLSWLEGLKKDNCFLNCLFYARFYSPGENTEDRSKESRRIAEGFISLQNHILEHIAKYNNTHNRKAVMKLHNLFKSNVTINEEDVEKAFAAQQENKGWSFFSERLHMESVFSQRVNFVLLLFPVLVAAFCNADERAERLIISIAGVLTLLGFYIPLKRTFYKLDIIQSITYKIKMGDSVENNPIKFVHMNYEKLHSFKRFPDVSSYSLIMWGILLMIVSMLVLLVLTACKIL